MKNLYLIIFLFIGIAASAQSPEKMGYQAVLRDANGALLKSQKVKIRFSVIRTSGSDTTIYQESQTPTTNSNGLISLYKGTGTVIKGDFSKIDWSKGPYSLQTDIDPAGGTNYVISSTTELVSVPYALYATTAEFADSLIGGVNFVDLSTAQTVAGDKTFSSDLTVNGITVGKGGGAVSTNTANGVNALYRNTTGDNNTANGYGALYSTTTGYANTANGSEALESNTTGFNNTANGNLALYFNTTGHNNTANGYNALSSNTTGYNNTANGHRALQYTTGSNNTATGHRALFSNTTGTLNTAIGYQADVGSSGLSNATAIGNGASVASSNTIQLGNTSVTNVKTSGTITAGAITIPNTDGTANQVLKTDGSGTLSWSTPSSGGVPYTGATGAVNLGAYDLTVNGMTVGKGGGAITSNTANGVNALYRNTTGDNNTANGYGALYSNTTGYANTANGSEALESNTTGFNNTANGNLALQSNTTGYRNTALGFGADVSLNNLSNATAIGYGATVSASNRVRIGNTSVSRIGGQVAWTNLSDGRIKENVQEAVPGLSFISQLRPVTYTLNTRKQEEITMQAMPDSIKEKRMLSDADYLESSSIVRTGFIAQEVEAAAQKVGFDFDGVSTPENETDLYGIRYAEFVVPLVKAMQEQQEMIGGQEATITELKATTEEQQATIEQQRIDFQNQLQVLLERIEALEKE